VTASRAIRIITIRESQSFASGGKRALMAQRIAIRPFADTGQAIARAAASVTGNIRLTVLLSVVLICGSFASAAFMQIRLDRMRAEQQAGAFQVQRAQTVAASLKDTLDHYAALAEAYADAPMSPGTARALAAAGRPVLQNVAVLDLQGSVISTLRNRPMPSLAGSRTALAGAANRAILLRAPDQSAFAIVFAHAGSLIAMEMAPAALMPRGADHLALLAPDGSTLAASDGARENAYIATAAVPGWPVRLSAGLGTDAAREAWLASLPLYLFVIFGPALAGAGLAFVFVREFEKRSKTNRAVKALRATRPAEAQLLVRLADAERRASEAERTKSEFLAHMSHELRTPLNAIIGFSEVIERGLFGPAGHRKYVEYARDIGAAGRGLHARIGDILEFASIEAGRYPLVIGDTDIVPIARACVEEIAGQTFSRRVKLQVSLPTSAHARADGAALKRVLINLLSNAARYTPEAGTIRVEAQKEAGSVCLRVRDSGTGFQPEERSFMGRPFARFARSGGETPGLGLGLAVSMALTRRMGGALVIRSVPGEGTVAELRLTRA